MANDKAAKERAEKFKDKDKAYPGMFDYTTMVSEFMNPSEGDDEATRAARNTAMGNAFQMGLDAQLSKDLAWENAEINSLAMSDAAD